MGLRGGRSVVECAKVFNLCLHDPILRNQTANLGGRLQAGGHDHPQTGWGEGVAAHRPRPLMPSIAKRGGSKEGRRALLIVAGLLFFPAAEASRQVNERKSLPCKNPCSICSTQPARVTHKVLCKLCSYVAPLSPYFEEG